MASVPANATPDVGNSGTDDSGPLDRATVIVAGVVIIGALMSILDATVINVALDTLSKTFGSPLSSIQWIISGYTLALASVIPISGWVADRFGARRVWLIAVAVFTTGSVLCSLAWSTESLIAFRVVQGLGGSILSPVGTTIVVQAAGPQRMGRVMALMGIPLLLGPVLGPVLGGFLLQQLSWHWIFLINVPIGVVAVTLGWRLLPRAAAQVGDRLDVAGVLLLSPGLAALIFSVSEIRSVADLRSWSVLLSAAVGVLLIGVFIWRSLRVKTPLVDLRLFVNRTFSSGALTIFALATSSFGAMLLIPLYLQQVRSESVLITGLLTTPQALGMGVAMSLSGRLADRIGAGWVVPVGVVISVGAMFGLTGLSATTSYWFLGGMLVILGLGLGSSMMPAMSAAYSTLSEAKVSRATTELQIVQRVGSTLGSALFAVVLQQGITALGAGLSGRGAAAPAQLAGAYATTFWWAVVLSALTLLPSLLLPRLHRHTVRGHSNPLAGNTKLEPKA